MKSLRIPTLLALALLLAPAVFAADFGIRAGRYNDSDQKFVGAEALIDLGALNLNPNIEYSLEDDVTAGSANLDLTFDVLSAARIRPFVGAGVGLTYLDDDFGDTETNFVGNLIGGVAFKFDTLTPYAQVKYFRVLDNDDEDADTEDDLAFTIGLRF
jgi:opacity protein-like surface antigen